MPEFNANDNPQGIGAIPWLVTGLKILWRRVNGISTSSGGDTSGLVPYTGATGNVILGTHNLTASTITGSAITVNGGFGPSILTMGFNNITASGVSISLNALGGIGLNGNAAISTGHTLSYDIGNTDSTAGTATLVNGTITISTTAVRTSDMIFLSLNTPGGTLGISYSAPIGSIVDVTSFVINSVAAAGTVVTTDSSTINWVIIHTS